MPITKAEYTAKLIAIADLAKEGWFAFGSDAFENVVSLVEAIKDLPGGDFKTSIDRSADSYRAQFGALSTRHGAPMLNNLFRDVLRLDGSEFSDPLSGFGDIFDWHIDNLLTVDSRDIVFDGSPTETGVGDNSVARLTEDSDGEIIENGFCPLDVNLEITTDQTGGAVDRFEEQYEFGAAVFFDILDIPGRTSNPGAPIAATNRDGAFISNGSFQNGQAGGVAVSPSTSATMAPWVDSTAAYGTARYVHDSTDTYRESFEEASNGLALSCEIKVDGNIAQPITNLDDFIPYFWSMRIMRKASATGIVTLKVGSNATCTVDLSTLTNDVWTLIQPDMAKELFPVRFKEDQNDIELITASLAAGSYKVDTITFEPMTQFNGSWWAMLANLVPGLLTSTPKKYVWSDTFNTLDSVIQRLMALALGLYLPGSKTSTSASSVGRTFTYADNGGSPDTITASTGSWLTESNGFKSGQNLQISGSSSNDGADYTIASVTALVITLIATDTLTNEGPNSGGEVLQATAKISDP